MGVHDVVVADRLRGLGAEHLAREDAELAGQLALAEALERAGVDVPHLDAVAGGDDRVERGAGGAGEDVDLDALGGHLPGQLDHVDVHPAGVAGARLVERGGVQADHRHALHRLHRHLGILVDWSDSGEHRHRANDSRTHPRGLRTRGRRQWNHDHLRRPPSSPVPAAASAPQPPASSPPPATTSSAPPAARDRIEALAAEIGGTAVACDVTSEESVAALATTVGERLDVLVNNAGGAFGASPVSAADSDEWRQMYEVNVIGLMQVTRALLPALVASGAGAILNVGSTAGPDRLRGRRAATPPPSTAPRSSPRPCASSCGTSRCGSWRSRPGW